MDVTDQNIEKIKLICSIADLAETVYKKVEVASVKAARSAKRFDEIEKDLRLPTLSAVAYFTELSDSLAEVEAPVKYDFLKNPILYLQSAWKRKKAFKILESIPDDLLQELYEEAKEAAKLKYKWEFVDYARKLANGVATDEDDVGYDIAQLKDYLDSFRAVKSTYARHYHSAEWSLIE